MFDHAFQQDGEPAGLERLFIVVQVQMLRLDLQGGLRFGLRKRRHRKVAAERDPRRAVFKNAVLAPFDPDQLTRQDRKTVTVSPNDRGGIGSGPDIV